MEDPLLRAIKHVSKDQVLAPIIKLAGKPDLAQHTDYYQELADSIIGQQLSVKAASTIKKRFRELFNGNFPEPSDILKKSIDDLRTAGLSRAKATYIQDLAQHIIDGSVVFDKLDSQSNDEIIRELTAVKGIGEWTAHMFLIFCMGRLDVLATGDLGIRSGIRALYGFVDLPTPEQVKTIATDNNWHPYESVACWYIWYSLDNTQH